MSCATAGFAAPGWTSVTSTTMSPFDTTVSLLTVPSAGGDTSVAPWAIGRFAPPSAAIARLVRAGEIGRVFGRGESDDHGRDLGAVGQSPAPDIAVAVTGLRQSHEAVTDAIRDLILAEHAGLVRALLRAARAGDHEFRQRAGVDPCTPNPTST